jgi:hypothetical protein
MSNQTLNRFVVVVVVVVVASVASLHYNETQKNAIVSILSVEFLQE